MGLVEERVAPLFRDFSLARLGLLALLAGVAEETLFRGLAQTWLAGAVPDWAALVLTSAAFGLLHWLSATYALLAGAAGLYLGLLLLFTGNLLVPIVAHAAYDLVALVILSRMKPRGETAVVD